MPPANARQQVSSTPIRGLSEGFSPNPGSLDRAENLRLDEFGAWRPCRGGVSMFFTVYNNGNPLPNPMANVGAIETIHWFSQHQGGRQYLVWEQRISPTSNLVDLVSFDGPNRSFKIIHGNRRFTAGPWLRTWYLAHADWLYFVNGYDQPLRWNGRWKVEIGFSQAAAPPIPRYSDENLIQDFIYPNWPFDATVAFHTNRVPANANGDARRGVGPRAADWDSSVAKSVNTPVYWTYGYAVTYVNDLGQESPPSVIRYITGWNTGADANPATVPTLPADAGRRGVIVQLPKPPPQAVGIRVWRTKNIYGVPPDTQLQAALFLHTEIACGVDTPVADLKPDSELGRQLDTSMYGPFPRNARMLAMFRGRMFVTTSSPSAVIYYSAPGFLEQFPDTNAMEIGDADSGPITAMHATRDALVVFKNRGVYLVREQADGTFRAETLSADIGCAAPRAVVEVPDVGVLFCSVDGIFLLVGALANEGSPTKIVYIGQAVASTWRSRVNKGALQTAWAAVNHQDREVWIQLPENARPRPTFGIVFHYGEKANAGAGAWTTRENWAVTCMAESRDERHYLFMGRNAPPYDIQLYSGQSEAIFTLAGTPTPVAAYMRSLPIGAKGGQVIWRGADVLSIAMGSGRSLLLDLFVNRRPVSAQGLSERRSLVDTESTVDNVDIKRSEWGTAVWDTDRWSDLDLTLVHFGVRPPGSPSEVQWGLSGTRFSVYGINIDIETNAATKTDGALSITGPR